jgi:hypothetical protein
MKKGPVKLMRVRFPAHQAIFQLNRSFEECIENLHQIMHFRFFNGDNLRTYELMLKEVRALTNHELAGVMSDREFENAAYYERLRLQWLEHLDRKSEASVGHTPEMAIAPSKRTPRRAKNQQKKKKVRP